ncbi:hypothetical protein F4781DRAFT_225034 [Annulohypoxylon bovei var. microspora]|nr:hypothetical protein F4781DRAFT_225034 [Annulohypoxylon bovei var. microspora]
MSEKEPNQNVKGDMPGKNDEPGKDGMSSKGKDKDVDEASNLNISVDDDADWNKRVDLLLLGAVFSLLREDGHGLNLPLVSFRDVVSRMERQGYRLNTDMSVHLKHFIQKYPTILDPKTLSKGVLGDNKEEEEDDDEDVQPAETSMPLLTAAHYKSFGIRTSGSHASSETLGASMSEPPAVSHVSSETLGASMNEPPAVSDTAGITDMPPPSPLSVPVPIAPLSHGPDFTDNGQTPSQDGTLGESPCMPVSRDKGKQVLRPDGTPALPAGAMVHPGSTPATRPGNGQQGQANAQQPRVARPAISGHALAHARAQAAGGAQQRAATPMGATPAGRQPGTPSVSSANSYFPRSINQGGGIQRATTRTLEEAGSVYNMLAGTPSLAPSGYPPGFQCSPGPSRAQNPGRGNFQPGYGNAGMRAGTPTRHQHGSNANSQFNVNYHGEPVTPTADSLAFGYTTSVSSVPGVGWRSNPPPQTYGGVPAEPRRYTEHEIYQAIFGRYPLPPGYEHYRDHYVGFDPTSLGTNSPLATPVFPRGTAYSQQPNSEFAYPQQPNSEVAYSYPSPNNGFTYPTAVHNPSGAMYPTAPGSAPANMMGYPDSQYLQAQQAAQSAQNARRGRKRMSDVPGSAETDYKKAKRDEYGEGI